MKSVFFIFTLSHAAGILQKNGEFYVADMEDENGSKNLYNDKELFRSFCEGVSDIERHIDNFNDDICRNLEDIKYLGTRFQSAADDFICYHEYGHQCVYEYLDEDFQKLTEFCLFFKTSISDKITILNEEACKHGIQSENGLTHTQILLQKIIIVIKKLNEANNKMTRLFKKIKNKIIKWERKVELLKAQFQCDMEENLLNKYHQGDGNTADNKRINIKDIIFGNSEDFESDTEDEISSYNEENKSEDIKDFEDENLDNKHNLAIENALYEYYDDNEKIVGHLENINAEHKKISSLLKKINILFSASYTIIDLEKRLLNDIKDSIKKYSINLINEKISLIKILQGKFLSRVNYLRDETKSKSLRIFIENNLESVNSHKKKYIKYFHDSSFIFPIKMFDFSIDKELNDLFLTLYLTFAELQIAIKIYTIEIKRYNIEIDSNFKKKWEIL